MTPRKSDVPATRRDLAATKSALSEMITATRSDLAATRSDLAATKVELKADIGRLDHGLHRVATDIVRLDGRMDRMERRFTTAFDGFKNDVYGKIDAFLSRFETCARESITIPKTLDEHGRALKDHEGRIEQLERPSI